MSDLISRGTVIEVLKQTGIIQDNDRGHLVVGEINRIPTAYDVEKVVAELEELPTYKFGVSLLNAEKYVKLSDLKEKIDIVRKGGDVNGNS